MNPKATPSRPKPPKAPSLLPLLKPYRGLMLLLTGLTVAANGFTLWVPKLISHAIDNYIKGALMHTGLNTGAIVFQFSSIAIAVFILTYLQSLVQTYASERVARDLRSRLVRKISVQSYAFVETTTPAKLLTNLTSDVDSVKLYVSQAAASIISSIFLILGASVLLLSINWRLGLSILGIIPIIGISLAFVLGKVRALFIKGQATIDWLNRLINESILGSALIRILYTPQLELIKFAQANAQAREIGMSILRLFAGLVPIITLAANLGTAVILALGGHFVITNQMTLGDFTAFNSYLSILIFPLMILGFMSNVIAQATASYVRLLGVLNAPDPTPSGAGLTEIRGDVALQDVTLAFGEKLALKNVSLFAKAGSTTAIIGPTAGGKTQLLYLLIGLLNPTSGTIEYDGRRIDDYDKDALHRHVGFVFQDSVLFNLTLRENIAFSTTIHEPDLARAIAAAELTDFIDALPQGLETMVAERGSSLSGGQKQRIMLARALALNPKVLLLDDFTARVDSNTEQAILKNVQEYYPDLTLISVTQKISSVENYDQIIVLMEGEVLATGTHTHLLQTCPEYVQINDSQRSTNVYELHT
jgi:ATP-binding cassette, subfamily B, bacterial